ncbi:uncharacterized protein BJ212DRAFT_1481051 [Suillus subaureus]|uniref:Uncharacterized protein n=1 Tax=Suillus subaureus TaxID=48587 RepID=A0A9P7EAD6_9AGAM|nr:uncharacterized protein BJ212DRAFT_1481051 [Suillus subaureus]KAG1815986.1 hypothetical protein BJ212DRAFT_1481051 [Suillus subaureus]
MRRVYYVQFHDYDAGIPINDDQCLAEASLMNTPSVIDFSNATKDDLKAKGGEVTSFS